MDTRSPNLQITVASRSPRASTGLLEISDLRLPCALGRSGLTANKFEGDGATPMGRWPLREVFYRADRIMRPATGLPVRQLRPSDGWCDAPLDRNYNRFVAHPYPASAERLWRQDQLYDLVIVLGYNDLPRCRGKGSAIFMHVAAPGFAPTEGCVALRRSDLLRLLALMHPGQNLHIGPYHRH